LDTIENLPRRDARALGKVPKQWQAIHALSRDRKEDHPSNVKHGLIDLTSHAEDMAQQLKGIEAKYVLLRSMPLQGHGAGELGRQESIPHFFSHFQGEGTGLDSVDLLAFLELVGHGLGLLMVGIRSRIGRRLWMGGFES